MKKTLDKGKNICYNEKHIRGISAVGSAQHWQCWGQGFESPMLHQNSRSRSDREFLIIGVILKIRNMILKEDENEGTAFAWKIGKA